MTKAIVIDTVYKQIKEVEISSDIKDLYLLLECSTFDVVRVNDDIDCFIDDESLLKRGYIDDLGCRHHLSGFKYGEGSVIMGNGILVGQPNEEGENTDCLLSVEEAEEMITFIDYDREEDRPQPFINVVSF